MASVHTGLSPSMALRSRRLGRRRTRSFLCKLQLGPRPDFKFELLPLHSPLLGQSLLVSFPPLIDMLKFSGYSYLIRGQPKKFRGFSGWSPPGEPPNEARFAASYCVQGPGETADVLGGPDRWAAGCPNAKLGLSGEMTLGQACPPEYRRAQCAFKDSMIH